jgi:DNA-binding CsgD family transcriptional regulator/tetratricopeptide (TPR) repeat protein
VASDDALAAGAAALAAGRWDEARIAFEAALAERETAEALDGLGEALWWLCDARSSIRHRERAYVKFRRAGDTDRACACALAVATSYYTSLDNAPAAHGWLARAERMLQSAAASPLQGWLWLLRGYMTDDLDDATELLGRALASARSSGDVDLELVAIADLGLALVRGGRVDEGLALVDEAMAGTLAGEYSKLETVVFTSCDMLAACSLVGDLQRAGRWCRVADDFIRDYGCPFLYARCRAHYGTVLVAKGRWDQAELELHAALRMSEDAGPEPRKEALAQLAELRLNQGRLEEAEALLAGLDDDPAAALPSAAVRLARGEPGPAVSVLERRLGQLGDRRIESAATMERLVRALVALGDHEAAAAVAARLEAVAQAQRHERAEALALLGAAWVALALGRRPEGVDLLDRAIALLARLELPLEWAHARLEQARALAGAQPELAVAAAGAARDAFETIGATRGADAAAALLRSLGVAGRAGPRDVGVLTKREQEVLRLLGAGLTNPEIAERLFISRKTAAHHVSHVLAKLGLRNRAQAVAYAARMLPQATGEAERY